MSFMFGIDLGGTKIEIIVLKDHQCLARHRVSTPQDYPSILNVVHQLIGDALQHWQGDFTLGIGMPGALTTQGLVKNSNTVCLNGKPFLKDIEQVLGLKVAIANDANCFALSEAIDGAGKDADSVFGVILGTGVGGGIVVSQRCLQGANRIAGEWGHNPLPSFAPKVSSLARQCYCGKADCIETFLNGLGFSITYQEISGVKLDAVALNQAILAKEALAVEAYQIYQLQLAASLSLVINIVDPEVVVLGGGLSHLPDLAENVQALLPQFVFSDSVSTAVRIACHGDSSGVRGAAWLWKTA